jgi:threonine/homoserine/homoserine lactone efflux protein
VPAFLPFDARTLLTYSLAAFALVLAPGPAQALVITRSVEGGTRSGLLTCLGLEIGTVVHTAAASVGLSAILLTSATAFALVKYAGAAYLVALGVIMLRRARASAPGPDASGTAEYADGRMLVAHAAMTGVLNPKVAVFFLAFLPQFVDPERGAVLAQFAVLGLELAVLGFLFDATLAVVVGRARGRLAPSQRFQALRRRVTGTVLVALGLRLLVADQR